MYTIHNINFYGKKHLSLTVKKIEEMEYNIRKCTARQEDASLKDSSAAGSNACKLRSC